MTNPTTTARKRAPAKKATAPRVSARTATGKADTEPVVPIAEPLALAPNRATRRAVAKAAPKAETAAKVKPPTVKFRGRTMLVKQPTIEQLGVWQRIIDRLGQVTDATTGPQAARLLGRGIQMIQSVLVDDRDRDWLEDQLMESDLDLGQAAEVITLTIAEFQRRGEANGQVNQGPAPKARRAR